VTVCYWPVVDPESIECEFLGQEAAVDPKQTLAIKTAKCRHPLQLPVTGNHRSQLLSFKTVAYGLGIIFAYKYEKSINLINV